MKVNLQFEFSVDEENCQINIRREFAAPVPLVWDAYTKSEILDQWWAPKPWKARTKNMDFRAGGHWIYAMVGPEGEEHWGRLDYKSINDEQDFTATDSFCDSEGVPNKDIVGADWKNTFISLGGNTLVIGQLTYPTLADLKTNVEMGFKEGMTAAMEGLDELLTKLL